MLSDALEDPVELTYQEDFLIQEECEIPVQNDFVEKLLQTVWTDDTLDEEVIILKNMEFAGFIIMAP